MKIKSIWFHVLFATILLFIANSAYGQQVFIETFEHTNFGGHRHPIIFDIKTGNVPEKAIMDLSGEPKIFRRMSSLKWSMPPGIAVIFVEHGHPGNHGRTYSITGSGQNPNTHNDNFGDVAQAWYWVKIE